MKNTVISNETFSGDRPLYDSQSISLQNVTLSNCKDAVSNSKNIVAQGTLFDGESSLNICSAIVCEGCTFGDNASKSLSYSTDVRMIKCGIDAKDTLSHSHSVTLDSCGFNNAGNLLWDCGNIHISGCKIYHSSYIMFHSSDIDIYNFECYGDNAFAHAKNVKINNANIESNNAFESADDITIYNSRITGNNIGLYAKKVTLVNCILSGNNMFKYGNNIVLENCEFEGECNDAFEYCTISAEIDNHISGIKNPKHGYIKCKSCDRITWDESYTGDTQIFIEVVDDASTYGYGESKPLCVR